MWAGIAKWYRQWEQEQLAVLQDPAAAQAWAGVERLDGPYRELQELAFTHLHPLRFRALAKAVKSARGNRAKAARLLDTTERILGYAVRKHHLDPDRHPGRELQLECPGRVPARWLDTLARYQ